MKTNKFTENSIDYPKKTLEAIDQEIKDINLKKVSQEVLEWLIANVEEYIDNVVGKKSTVSFSKMLIEFRKTFLNIDMDIINDLQNLFFTLWE